MSPPAEHPSGKTERPLAVKVDFREDAAGIGEILERNYKAAIERQALSCGDYVINGSIVVERKTSADFALSIIDGRLFQQAVRMKRTFDAPVFIIEGENLDSIPFDVHPHALRGALVSLALDWQIPSILSASKEETALFLWLMGSQNVSSNSQYLRRFGRRPKRFRNRQLYILQGLPGVGPKLAHNLLDCFGSIEKIVLASAQSLTQVPLMGIKKVAKIRKILERTAGTEDHCG